VANFFSSNFEYSKLRRKKINGALFGTKHLDSLDWMEIVDMFNRKEHNTSEGKEKIIKIKSGMNNYRTNFTWDHLQKFYNVKI